MLSKIIVSSYKILLEICIWLLLLGGFVWGWKMSGFFGAIIGLIGAFIFCVVLFGAFLTLLDIRQSVRAIEAHKQTSV
jgi:hypothetical protein